MAGESEFPAVEAAAVDALAESYQRRGGQPGIAYGIVAGGAPRARGGIRPALCGRGPLRRGHLRRGRARAGLRRTPGRSSVSRR